MECFVVAKLPVTSASRGPSVIAELLVKMILSIVNISSYVLLQFRFLFFLIAVPLKTNYLRMYRTDV